MTRESDEARATGNYSATIPLIVKNPGHEVPKHFLIDAMDCLKEHIDRMIKTGDCPVKYFKGVAKAHVIAPIKEGDPLYDQMHLTLYFQDDEYGQTTYGSTSFPINGYVYMTDEERREVELAKFESEQMARKMLNNRTDTCSGEAVDVNWYHNHVDGIEQMTTVTKKITLQDLGYTTVDTALTNELSKIVKVFNDAHQPFNKRALVVALKLHVDITGPAADTIVESFYSNHINVDGTGGRVC